MSGTPFQKARSALTTSRHPGLFFWKVGTFHQPVRYPKSGAPVPRGLFLVFPTRKSRWVLASRTIISQEKRIIATNIHFSPEESHGIGPSEFPFFNNANWEGDRQPTNPPATPVDSVVPAAGHRLQWRDQRPPHQTDP